MADQQRIDASLIAQLLYQCEGVDLDFKREQYAHDSESDLDRGELLKDILAFANSFRLKDAMILIGVDEPAGGRPTLVGITNHLKDADVQQFVNTKTNRKVVFSYHIVEVQEKEIGLITITTQDRPIYLLKPFGWDDKKKKYKLEANTVYIRVGSSTAVATPDEIKMMGMAAAIKPRFEVSLQFADLQKKVAIGDSLCIETIILECDEETIPLLQPGDRYNEMISTTNQEFLREVFDFVVAKRAFAEIGFFVENLSDATITDVKVELTFSTEVLICHRNDLPKIPQRKSDRFGASYQAIGMSSDGIEIEKRDGSKFVTLSFGKLQAGQREFLSCPLYIACREPKELHLHATIRADEFISPLIKSLSLKVNGATKDITWSDFQTILDDMASEYE